MKRFFRNFFAMVMCMSVLFVGNTAFWNACADTYEPEETNAVTLVSEELAQDAEYVSYDDFVEGNIQTLNPVTVVYGYDLDVTAVKDVIRDIKTTQQTTLQSASGVNAEKRNNHQNREKDENSILCMYVHIEVDGFFADYYEELSFADEVSQNTRLEMAQSLTTQESMQQIAYDFIYNQLQSEPAVVSEILNENTSATSTTRQYVVAINDTVTVRHTDNYTPSNTNNVYPMVMYKATNTYRAYLETSSSTDEYQIYTLHTKSTVIPGHQQEAYSGVSGVYNNTYHNAIVIAGVAAEYINDFAVSSNPEAGDQIVSVTPGSRSNIEGETVDIRLMGHPDSFCIDRNGSCKISINTTCNSLERATVKIMAESKVIQLVVPNMGTTAFDYAAMAKFYSIGDVLLTTAETSVYCRFQNESNNTKVWSQHELYYEAG